MFMGTPAVPKLYCDLEGIFFKEKANELPVSSPYNHKIKLCHGSGPVAHLAQVTHLAGKFHLHCFLVCYGNCHCLMTQHLSGCL